MYRESNGFFTALSKYDETVKIWSTATGKLLHKHKVDLGLPDSVALREFTLYRPPLQEDQEDGNHLIDSQILNEKQTSLIIKNHNDDSNLDRQAKREFMCLELRSISECNKN